MHIPPFIPMPLPRALSAGVLHMQTGLPAPGEPAGCEGGYISDSAACSRSDSLLFV